MTDTPQSVDFDRRPPMPVAEYEQTVKRVNVGYELVYTLVNCFLRALGRPDLHVLVVGAGGGAEIERLLPANPGWRMTGVDPSQDMLALAQAKAEHLGVAGRVRLILGTVEDLPTGARFDAATCLYVLHFLPDEAKLALLQAVAARRHSDAPVLLAVGARVQIDDALGEDLLGAWQQYGELAGMPAERMAATIHELMAQQVRASAEQDYVRLLREAGYQHVGSVLSVMAGGMEAWIAR
ncbi:MAG: class I SAM-dependent methyltransferase [Chloroflexi bacterium]|nr:class I SAM-dependent methyltransferase [Chloroflexota bacterium]